MLIVNKHWTIFTNLYPPSMGQARVHPRGGGLQSVAIRHSLRGRRLKGKGKGVLSKGVLGARETRGARLIPSAPSLSNACLAGYIRHCLTCPAHLSLWLFTIYKKNSGNFGWEFSFGKNGTYRLPSA